MKLILLAPICLLLACSSPRYLYRFHEPPGSVTNRSPAAKAVVPTTVTAPVATPGVSLVYSADAASPLPRPPGRLHRIAEDPVAKPAVKSVEKAPPSEEHLDGDLKRAVIFAVAGGIALIIGGQVFYVAGSLSLLIGLIFGIKWFIRQ